MNKKNLNLFSTRILKQIFLYSSINCFENVYLYQFLKKKFSLSLAEEQQNCLRTSIYFHVFLQFTKKFKITSGNIGFPGYII